MKRLSSIILAILILLVSTGVSAASEFSGGSGTMEDPYLVANIDDLNLIQYHLDSHFELAADIIFTESDSWTPIGSSTEPFTGTFDGKTYTISNCSKSLFRYNEGTILNVTIENGDLITSYNGVFDGTNAIYGCIADVNLGSISNCVSGQNINFSERKNVYLGGIVGKNDGGTISNCVFNGKIEAGNGSYDSWNYSLYAGSISGSNTNGGLIEDCKNSAAIIIYGGSRDYIGGITGEISSAKVKNCNNLGNITYSITGSKYDYSSDIFVGGIVGNLGLSGSIENCNNNGKINVSSTHDKKTTINVGGISGGCKSNIISSENSGNVSVTLTQYSYYSHYDETQCNLGGIVGTYYSGKINENSNAGKITGKNSYGNTRFSFCGGIIGNVKDSDVTGEKSISNCCNSGKVSSIVSSSVSLEGTAYAGGIVGCISEKILLQKGYNNGDIVSEVTGDGRRVDTSVAKSGGIAGYNLNGEIKEFYNTGNVRAISCQSSVAGGIVGENTANGVIENTFHLGEGTSNVSAYCKEVESNYGGLVGKNEGTVKNSYTTGTGEANIDKNTGYSESSEILGTAYCGALIGFQNGAESMVSGCSYKNVMDNGYGNKTDNHTRYSFAQMMKKSSFEEFDFTDIWTMDGNEDYLLPELQGVKMIYPQLVSVSFAVKPEKLIYTEAKDDLDVSDGELLLTWEDQIEELIPLEMDMVTGFDKNIVGTQELTVNVAGKITTYEVKVVHDYVKNEIPPTCTEQGYTEYTCSACGNYYVDPDSYINALGHISEIDEAIPATCTDTGLTEGSHCSVCDEVLISQKIIEATGHLPVTTPAKAPTCSEIGLTEGSHCLNCKKVFTAQMEIEKIPHTEVLDYAVAPTCAKNGLSEGSHCSVCNAVIKAQSTINALGHKWDNGVVTKEPSTLENGFKIYSCTRCGKTTTESIPKLTIDIVFDDVLSGGDWFAFYVYDLVSQGIINGKGYRFDGTPYFEPQGLITRAEFSKILAAASGDDLSKYESASNFADVGSHWAAKYINWAYDHGIVTGFPDGTFGAEKQITREQMAVMICRYADYNGITLPKSVAKANFADDDLITWSSEYVYAMQQAGIINGYNENGGFFFKPQGNATRAESATMISKFLDI